MKTTKAKIAAPVAKPKPTPQQERDRTAKRLTEVVPQYLKMHTAQIAEFATAAVSNALYAIEWRMEQAAIASFMRNELDRLQIEDSTDFMQLAADVRRAMDRRIERLTQELTSESGFRSNSTSELSNLLRRCEWRAKQIVLSLFRYIVWELNYLDTLDAAIASGVPEVDGAVNPVCLL